MRTAGPVRTRRDPYSATARSSARASSGVGRAEGHPIVTRLQEPIAARSVATIVPTSTHARPAVFRPRIELGGVANRFLVDQLRSIDVRFIDGEPAHFLHRDELEEVAVAVTRYIGP